MDTKNFIAEKLDRDELIRLIEYHNRRYWDEGEPEIPDARYDELIRALQKLEPDHELVTRVYAPAVAGSGKVRHLRPMLSLDKAYSLEEVLEWAKKFARSEDEELLVEPKYDGISANFDGRVLSTRGDGELGENVTDKLPLVELETAGHTGKVDRPVRGELVIRDDDFKTLYSHIRKKGGGVYKNSRNAVARDHGTQGDRRNGASGGEDHAGGLQSVFVPGEVFRAGREVGGAAAETRSPSLSAGRHRDQAGRLRLFRVARQHRPPSARRNRVQIHQHPPRNQTDRRGVELRQELPDAGGGAGTGRNLRHHHPPRHVAQHPEHSRTGRADRRYRDR